MPDEIAWLIERKDPLSWWHGCRLDLTDFTSDASEAMRFGRQQDAARMIGSFAAAGCSEALVATEHIWVDSGARLNAEAIAGRRNRDAYAQAESVVETFDRERRLTKMALDLCYAIEKLPASDQQTAVSIQAAALHDRLKDETQS